MKERTFQGMRYTVSLLSKVKLRMFVAKGHLSISHFSVFPLE